MTAAQVTPNLFGRAMKATAGRNNLLVAQPLQVAHSLPSTHVSLTSSVVLSLVLHGALVLWLLGSAWLLADPSL
jgi:hypothetical protein